MNIKLAHGSAYAEKINGYGWYLHFVRVDDGYRNKGIGTRLMENIIKRCSGNTIYLLVTSELDGDVERLYKFYERFGFEKQEGNHIGYNYNMVF